MTVVAIANQKGGVGKTTIALALAAEAARRGGRALVIDMDPQANATDTIALPAFDPEEMPTIYDVMSSGLRDAARDAWCSTRWEGVDLVPGDIKLADFDQWSLAAEQKLKRALGDLSGDYDLVVIDCPRALGALTAAALAAAELLVIVAEPTKDSLKGVRMLLDTTALVRESYNPALRLGGIILNRVGRTNAKLMRAGQLVEAVGSDLISPALPESADIARITESARILPIEGESRAARAGRIVASHLDHLYAMSQRCAK